MNLTKYKAPKNKIPFLFLIYCSTALAVTYMFGLPKILLYSVDALNVGLAFYCLYFCKFKIKKKHNRSMKIVAFLLAVSITIGYFLNQQSVLLFLWGARNNYRGVLFMFICMTLMKSCQKKDALQFFDKMFWIHILFVLYQFFVMGCSGDYIGGVFGVTQGGNSGNNLMLCIISTIALWKYLHKEYNILNLLIRVGVCFAVAAVAELKFFFVEIFIIIAILLLLNGGLSRKIKALLAMFCGLVIGLYLLYAIFPQWVGYFTLDHFIKLLDGGRKLNGASIDRFSSLPEIYRIFYSGKGAKFLFGYGLGTADYSLSYSFLTSHIYTKYYYTGYSQLSYAFLFIELGAIGFVLYSLLIAVPVIKGIKNKDRDEYNSITVVIGILCLLLLFYDVTMKIEPQYFAFFVLSMPFWNKDSTEEAGDNNTSRDGIAEFVDYQRKRRIAE